MLVSSLSCVPSLAVKRISVFRFFEALACGVGRAVLCMSLVGIVVWVVQDDVRWETLDNPLVLQAFVGGHPFLGIPFEASANEIYKRWVWSLSQFVHNVVEAFLLLLLGQNFEGSWDRVIFELREELLPLRVLQDLLRWHSNHIDDELELLLFVGSREEREACKQFDDDAAKTPHVNLLGVWEETQDNIRCSVEPALDVGVHDLIFKASATEISDHDSRFVLSLE